MNELLLSGCRADQYSYDARFGRRYHGAMTHYALGDHRRRRTIACRTPSCTAGSSRPCATPSTTRSRSSRAAPRSSAARCSHERVTLRPRRPDRPHRHRRHLRRRPAGGPRRRRLHRCRRHHRRRPAAPARGAGRLRRAPAASPRAASITPGLIDLHNHLAYNTLPLWSAPRDAPYTSRHQWPGAATYGRDVSNPAQALGIAAAAATLRYAEVRAAAGGVTSIQGSPPVTRAFAGWMVRNIEKEQIAAHGKEQLLFQAVIKADVAGAARSTHRTSPPGGRSSTTSPRARRRRCATSTPTCAEPAASTRTSSAIHSTALGRGRVRRLGASRAPAPIVWSPFSNIWLYGGDDRRPRGRGATATSSASARTGDRRARRTCSAS